MSSMTEKNLDWDSLVNSSEPIFWNLVFDKGRLKTFVSWFFKKYGEKKTLVLLEQLKEVGFGYATNAGISLGIEDLKIPPQKNQLLAKAEMSIQKSNFLYRQGRLTGIEKMQKFIETWHETSETLKEAVVRNFEKTDILNPVYMMAFSGARGNMSQVRQLVGMRGLMSDPQGKIIDFPIQSNFREGLTLTEYLISTYGARKGIVDTALRTATAGYLTRRLVDVAQHVIVSKFDCGTQRGIFLFDMKEGSQTLYSFQNRLIGRVLAQDILKHKNSEEHHVFTTALNALERSSEVVDSNKLQKSTQSIAFRNQEVTFELALTISKVTKKALVRSPLTCENRKLVCQLCYGWSLATSRLVSIGEAVGVIAGQSIGEPGTQLTMRTFHTGGVFSAGVTQQINAPFSGFVEYAEPIAGTCVRTPHGQFAFLTKTNGTMFLKKASISLPTESQTYKLPAFTILFVRHGQWIEEHELLAQISALPVTVQTTQTIEQTIYSTFEGEVYYDELDLLEDIDERYGERISTSEDWAKVWILAGKIYNPAFQSTFLACAGDFVQKTTVLNQIKWSSPSLLTAQSLGIEFCLPTRQTFQGLRYFSTFELGKDVQATKQTKKSVKGLEHTLKDLIPQFRIRSIYSLKDFFMTSKTKVEKPILKINRTFSKTRRWTCGSENFREFLYSSQIKTSIFKHLMTDSLCAYQRIKELQALILQMTVSFPHFAPGSLAKFIKLSRNEKDSMPREIKKPEVRLRNLNKIFDLKQSEETTFLHPFILMNYVPSIVKIKTLRNYFKLLKTSTFVSSLNNSLGSSVLEFLPHSSRFYLSSLKHKQKISNMNFRFRTIRWSLSDQNVGLEITKPSRVRSFARSETTSEAQSFARQQSRLSKAEEHSSKFSYSRKISTFLRKKTWSLNISKLKNLNHLTVSTDSVRPIKSKTVLNPIRLENLMVKRPIISLPTQHVSYSKFGYVMCLASKDERFFAFSSLTKNTTQSCLNLQESSILQTSERKSSRLFSKRQTFKEAMFDSKNSDAWKPLSFKNDLQWFPEFTRFKFSGLLFFKSPNVFKRVFRQTLINRNLKSGKPLVTGLDLKKTLKNFDLSNSQVQKKAALKESSDFKFSNGFLFSTKFKVQSNSHKSNAKIQKSTECPSNFLGLDSFSAKRTSIISPSKLSFFLFRKATFTVKNQTSLKNSKKFADLRQLLFSLSRKQAKNLHNPFFKTEGIEKNHLTFAELEWIPQENYRLNFFTKQKTLNNFKKRKVFFMTKNLLKNQNSAKLMLYLTNLQGKKKLFSFKYEGYLALCSNSTRIFNKTNFKNCQNIKETTVIRELKPTSLEVRSIDQQTQPSSEQSLEFVQGQKTISRHLTELYSDFSIDFFDNKGAIGIRDSTLDLGSNAYPNIDNQYFASRSSAGSKSQSEYKVRLKDASLLTHSLKLSFLNYLKRKALNLSGRKKTLFRLLNTFYASCEKDLLQKFFTFVPLIKKSKPLQTSNGTCVIAESNAEHRSANLFINSTGKNLILLQTVPKKESYVDFTVKPGWIYCPTNSSEIFQLNKIFAGSGKNFIDDVLFEQHKVFLEILPKTVDLLSHFTYTPKAYRLVDQSNCSNYFERKTYVQNVKSRFLKNVPFGTKQSCCLLIRPVYYQIFPASSQMKTRLYKSVQKQEQLNFFISFNFYKNYFSEVLNLQSNLLRTVSNFAKLDINVEELSIFPISPNCEKVLVKKLVSGSSRNLLENTPKRNHKIVSLTKNIKFFIDSRRFLKMFYEKKDSLLFFLSETQSKKAPISLQSHYFSNSHFSSIQLKISLSNNRTNSDNSFSELSFHRAPFKPEKISFSRPNFFYQVRLKGSLIKIKNDLALKTLKFQKIFKESNSKMNRFDALPFFEYSASSTYAFLANQRLFASVFSKDRTDLFNNNYLRFAENSFNSYCYKTSFLKLPVSTNVLLLNSQNNSFSQIIGFTNFGSPFEGEVLQDLSDKLTGKSLEKTVNVYLEKTLKNHRQCQKLILTKSDIFSLKFPFVAFQSNQRPMLEKIQQTRTSGLFFKTESTKNTFKYLLAKYSNLKKLEETSLERFNSQSYKLSNFQTTYKHKTYRLNALTLEFVKETKKLRLGHFIQPGEKLYSKMSLLNSGQIIHLSHSFLTLRKAEFFSVSPKAILHTYNGDYLEKNLPVMTLPFETLKTGDIVQGIPKVEQYLEARTTIKGRLFLNSLPVLLQAIYKRYLGYFNMENAVRQSFLKIQQILVDGVQRVYRSQGVSIADKHLEIIVRQMTSKVRIVHGGQTGFFSGELVDLEFVERLNRFLKVKIRYEPVVLGITRASLEVDSFLSAASFQQTTKVLTRAAVENRRDFLKGLKESLLVGNLLPAGTGYVLPLRKLN